MNDERWQHLFRDYGTSSFSELLRRDSPHLFPTPAATRPPVEHPAPSEAVPHGTTVLALRYRDGVIMAGDRQATAGYQVASRGIEKIFKADDLSGVGIAVEAGPAMEMAKLFQTELEHYEKVEGDNLSLEGKANKLGQMIRMNLQAAMMGLAVVPIFAGFDEKAGVGRLFKYDITGGRYEEKDYDAQGSGSKDARDSLKKLWRRDIARGRSIVTLEYRDGILLVAENPSSLLHKVSEIYDRIAFAGVGKYNEFENLRIAGIRHADIKGYSYSRGDVTAKALANAYSQALGNIFTQDIKPFEVEVLVAEVGDDNGAKSEIYHILYDGTIEDERNYAAMGGQADEIRRFLKDHYQNGMELGDALQLGVRALTVTQNKTLTERDLEVAVLDRTKARRKFRRIPLEALGQLLGTAR